MVTKLNPLADVRRFVIDRNTPFQDQALHLQAGPHARLGQNFVQFGRFGLGLQYASGLWPGRIGIFQIERTGHDCIKQAGGLRSGVSRRG